MQGPPFSTLNTKKSPSTKTFIGNVVDQTAGLIYSTQDYIVEGSTLGAIRRDYQDESLSDFFNLYKFEDKDGVFGVVGYPNGQFWQRAIGDLFVSGIVIREKIAVWLGTLNLARYRSDMA